MAPQGEKPKTLKAAVEEQAGRLRELSIALNEHADSARLMMPKTKGIIHQWSGVLNEVAIELIVIVNGDLPPEQQKTELGVINKLGRGAVVGLVGVVSFSAGVAADEASDVADHLGFSEWIAGKVNDAVGGADEVTAQLDAPTDEEILFIFGTSIRDHLETQIGPQRFDFSVRVDPTGEIVRVEIDNGQPAKSFPWPYPSSDRDFDEWTAEIQQTVDTQVAGFEGHWERWREENPDAEF